MRGVGVGRVNAYGKRVLLIVSTYLLNIDCIFCSSSSLISSDDLLLVVVSNLSVNNATSDTLDVAVTYSGSTAPTVSITLNGVSDVDMSRTGGCST